MADRASEYQINQSLFRVAYGDITDLSVEAIVSSDDTYLSMGGGVSYAIASKAGDELRAEARKHVPLQVGDVVATSAGKLAARYVFHAATLDYERMVMPNEAIVGQATERCLKLAEALGVRTIAFPALGTGVGGFPFEVAAETMLKAIVDHLSARTDIELVVLSLWTRDGVQTSDLNFFYERAVGIASVLAESQSLTALVGELKNAAIRAGRSDVIETVSQLENQLAGARSEVLRLGHRDAGRGQVATGATVETIGAIRASNPQRASELDVERLGDTRALHALGQVSQESIVVSDRVSEELEAWSDRQLSMELARTRIAALATQLNTNVAVLNKFEIERAKYGGIAVPPRLDFAIDELHVTVAGLESELTSAKANLARLATQ